MTAALRALRRTIVHLADRLIAQVAVQLGIRIAGCCDCGAASVRFVTWGPDATHGLHPSVWSRCTFCADKLLADPQHVAALAASGCTWVCLPRSVWKPECETALIHHLFEHRWPFAVTEPVAP